ncbi:hypothetical protein BCR43DRAFT_119818 [Syncephalastrum racemosum]|uniref:F-box domain-containing protein n=1 Tax=Syncephalastrum racemosum TaxID=13706 RepID=A0A1X2GZK9_SYNRA|nr:hypothetical protein BCR43DRAFT_119818 [Syncephalastrum racemosum]
MREPIHMASESHPSYSSMEFFESIVHLGEHLTELTLRMMWRPHQLIRTILAALPQLVFLTCEDTHGRVINDERCPHIPLPASVQLQHLACDGAYWALEELDFIPSIAPRLRSFQIAMDLQNLFAYNPLFENFQQMCPNLQAFDCSGRCAYPITKKWFGRFYSQEHHDHSPSGLRFFAVYPQAFNRGSSGIPDWIFQNQGSLEVLSCGARSQPLVGVADVQSERFICCKRLTALDIRVGFPAQLGQLHRFLLSHPS